MSGFDSPSGPLNFHIPFMSVSWGGWGGGGGGKPSTLGGRVGGGGGGGEEKLPPHSQWIKLSLSSV